MKYNNKKQLKEEAIQLYLAGNNMTEIGKTIGCSRNFVSELIKGDKRIKQYKNKKKVKLYKWKNQSRITLPVSVEYWEKIGVSKDINIHEFVEIMVDEDSKTIVIKKV